ncbi:tRNA 2-selenouridine synthase [Campylobacter showae]|uniref:tRNA 2-selenouridine synthase n=1 Tax=Campylobacter showae TaxID=204 RepID=UPI000F08DBEA|nr:tRNA 2-selenouridine synthase [Campylobacter showae]
MKFILSILALLAIAFLVGCSAKDTSNKSELNNKYGGIYIFNKKYYEEIQQREKKRKEAIKELKGRDLGGGLYAVDTKPVDQKFPQTLSNGKKYYTDTADYSREYSKQPKVPEIYKERIRNLIGKENLDKIPGIGLGSFYSDEEGNITPITMYIQYSDKVKSYGLFGDEGRGFSLSRDRFEYYEVKNKFYMEDLEK